MDWIESFMEATTGLNAPPIFRQWCAIAAVGGALERRVYTPTNNDRRLYPNLYVLLTAVPGIGKTEAIALIGNLWRKSKRLHVSPDNLTTAGLVKGVMRSKSFIDGKTNGPPHEYHSFLVSADEFGTFVPAHDLAFLSVVNKLYDNPDIYSEERADERNNRTVPNPQLHILAGTQPGYLASLMPDEAWAMGFTARLTMIYGGSEPIDVPMFAEHGVEANPHRYDRLGSTLEALAHENGPVIWEERVKITFENWRREGYAPIPTHSKLEHYSRRRNILTIKLAMISAASQGCPFEVTPDDLDRARGWMLDAEERMPDIFREMAGKNDSQAIKDLHFALWKRWTVKPTPIHEDLIHEFLGSRVPVEKISRLIELAERMRVIMLDPPGKVPVVGQRTYRPRPINEHGIE